ncbi:MAG: 6,7-dimethyl-8-ribityllumazine synthase [Oligoflexia bacterium]|nr:6,7-dimethyl-8-ribityllumazine synthase [Oligoflexia bacterium]
MPRIIEGKLDAGSCRISIVVSRFNSFMTQRMLDGALDILSRHGADINAMDVVWVPGAFEIPLACKKLAQSKKYDGVVALACVIRGSTPHFEFVSSEVSKGIAAVMLETGMPVGFGIVTADTIEQAIERAGSKSGNKGAESAQSVIEQINLFKQFK